MVVLCTTSKESTEFNQAIEQIAKEYKFRIFRSDVPLATARHKPNPWGLFRNTLHGKVKKIPIEQETEVRINKEIARDEIIRDSFEVVTTKYCIFLDGDTVAHDDLRTLVGEMELFKYDLASVRVLASQQKTIMEKLQSVEYELAMDARQVYPWLTSGACMVAKTAVIQEIMGHHSLFFSGGDIEIGKLAKMLHFKVGHIHFKFYTDVPPTFKGWFKQRMAWCGGGFRHAVVNIHQYTWRHPFFYFYVTFLVYLLWPLRWYEMIIHPTVVPIVIVLYWLFILFFHLKIFKLFYLLFPFYALIQVMVLIPLGMYMYIRMARSSRNSGFIKLRKSVIS
jgi:cellulose synthase/poly-beta-1,6-N-acetylglucosamine synthase-like glycosyltransferase